MPQLIINDFKNGMDRTRPRANGVPGSLWRAENGVITRGGDFAKAKRFVPIHELPAGQTFGLARVNGRLQVYASSPVAAPAGVSVRAIAAPSGADMIEILDVKTPGGIDYVMARYADGNTYHYYNGARVTDWDAIADENASLGTIASRLGAEIAETGTVEVVVDNDTLYLTATEPGTAFSVSASAINGAMGTDDQSVAVTTVQANVAEVANVDATGTFTLAAGSLSPGGGNRVDTVSVDGVDLLDAPILFGTSLSATANAVASAISDGVDDHGFLASSLGAVVTITAPEGTGATHNGETVAFTVSGDVTASKTDMAGGVDAVAPVAQIVQVTLSGTVNADEHDDVWTITLDSVEHKITTRASAMGTFGLVNSKRMVTVANNLVVYSALEAFSDFSTDAEAETGYGFFAPANESGNSQLTGLGKYQGRLAIMAGEDIVTYFFGADAATIEIDQPIVNTGTVSPGSVQSYGSRDMFYLDETGIRSLQPRDSSNAAFVSDVGSLIDEYIKELRELVSPAAVANAVSIVDPVDGRYWLAIGTKILTFSGFRDRKIVAWTVQDFEVAPTAFVRVGRDLYMRAGDTIYRYGGASGSDHVEAGDCVFETAFMDCDTPGTHKQFTGFDFVCSGTWKIEILTDPDDPSNAVTLGYLSGQTLNKQHVAYQFRAAIFAIRATCVSEGEASFSKIIAHFQKVDAQ